MFHGTQCNQHDKLDLRAYAHEHHNMEMILKIHIGYFLSTYVATQHTITYRDNIYTYTNCSNN